MWPNSDSNSAKLYARAEKVEPGGINRLQTWQEPFPVYAASGDGAYVTDVDGVRRLDLATGEISVISLPEDKAKTPDISPDGRHMVFVRRVPTGEHKVFVMRLEDQEQAKLTGTAGKESETQPCWSHNGGKIYFSYRESGMSYHAAMEIGRDGEAMEDICEAVRRGSESHHFPVVSPSGKQLAWIVRNGGLGFVRVMDTRLSALAEDYAVPGYFMGAAEWLPGERELAVAYLELENPQAGYSLGILNLATLELRPWIDISNTDGHPRLSPDGKQMLFRAKVDKDFELFIADLP